MFSVASNHMGMDATSVTTILNNLNSLYSNAISQLITYTIGVLAFVGIIIPLAISLLQNKQLKADNKALADQINSELNEAKNTLSAELKLELSKETAMLEEKIAETRKKLEEEIAKTAARLNAKAHHAQGNANYEKSAYLNALEDYLIAINGYAKALDEANVKGVFANLQNVLKLMTQSDFSHKERIDELSESAMGKVGKINTNARYTSDIREFKEALSAAKNRPKPDQK